MGSCLVFVLSHSFPHVFYVEIHLSLANNSVFSSRSCNHFLRRFEAVNAFIPLSVIFHLRNELNYLFLLRENAQSSTHKETVFKKKA